MKKKIYATRVIFNSITSMIKIHTDLIENGYSCYTVINNHPTGNCQLRSISWFDYFLARVNDDNIPDRRNHLKYLFLNTLLLDWKPMVLVDVTEYIYKSKGFKDFCKEFVEVKKIKRYISTNKSRMVNCIMYLDKDKVKDYVSNYEFKNEVEITYVDKKI